MRHHLHRYVTREILGPLAVGFSVYTFIMLVRFMFQSAEMIIRRGVPGEIIGQLLLVTLPNIIVLTIPMALLFAILTAVGRLASDSELVAMRASGVSLLTLYRPILLISGAMAAINVLLMVYAMPWGNASLQQLRLEILSQSVSRQVEPRVFYSEWEGKVLYVFRVDPENPDVWDGVFLAETFGSNESLVTVADAGRVRVDPSGEQVILELTDAASHRVDLNNPERYHLQRYERLSLVLEEAFTSSRRERITAAKGVRELGLPDLVAWAVDRERSKEARLMATVEIHKKFAIPAACLVFGLIALPLGFNNRRGSKASGFALSILVILVYYVLLSNGEEAARFGKAPPWLAMWLPNLLLTAGGLFLLIRRNRDKSLLLSRVDRWVRQDFWAGLLRVDRWRKDKKQARAGRRSSTPDSPTAGNRPQLLLRIPRLRLAFPNLADRYTLRHFVGVLVMVLLSALTLYAIADLSEKIDEVLKNEIPRQTVLAYYQYLSLQIFYDVAPIVVLITTLITFSLLSRSNEVTAFKAVGISLYRLSVPAILAALGIALFCAYLDASVLPVTNRRSQQLEDQIMGRASASPTFGRERQWLYGQGGYIYNYLLYDQADTALQRLQIFELDDDARLERRLVAEKARYDEAIDGGGWLFENGWARSFEDGQLASYEPFAGPLLIDYPETPEFFASDVRPPEQMRYADLKHYIAELEASGQKVPELEVALYNKAARPVASLVMALVGLPFAFRLGRQGTLYGIGISIVIGMVFFAVLAAFNALGQTGLLPAAVAVWSPNIAFATLSIYLFLGLRT